MFNVGTDKLIVVTSEPLDKNLVGKIADNLGEITVYAAGFPVEHKETEPAQEQAERATAAVSAPAKPQADKNGIVIRENNAGGAQGDEQILHPHVFGGNRKRILQYG